MLFEEKLGLNPFFRDLIFFKMTEQGIQLHSLLVQHFTADERIGGKTQIPVIAVDQAKQNRDALFFPYDDVFPGVVGCLLYTSDAADE